MINKFINLPLDLNKFEQLSDRDVDQLVLTILQMSVVPVDASGLVNLVMVFGGFTLDSADKLAQTVEAVNKSVTSSLNRLLEVKLVELQPRYWEFDSGGQSLLGYVAVGLLDAVAHTDSDVDDDQTSTQNSQDNCDKNA